MDHLVSEELLDRMSAKTALKSEFMVAYCLPKTDHVILIHTVHMEQSRLQRSIPLVVAAQAEWMKGKIKFLWRAVMLKLLAPLLLQVHVSPYHLVAKR